MVKNYIVIHHSGDQDGNTFDWSAIRTYHTSYRVNWAVVTAEQFHQMKANPQYKDARFEEPWRDIGYHFGIEKVNDHYEILFGRMPEEKGAHCPEASMNERGIGICVVGNWDSAIPPKEQFDKLVGLCKWLMKIYGIEPEHVIGHRDGPLLGHIALNDPNKKTCPGKMFDMEYLRRQLA